MQATLLVYIRCRWSPLPALPSAHHTLHVSHTPVICICLPLLPSLPDKLSPSPLSHTPPSPMLFLSPLFLHSPPLSLFLPTLPFPYPLSSPPLPSSFPPLPSLLSPLLSPLPSPPLPSLSPSTNTSLQFDESTPVEVKRETPDLLREMKEMVDGVEALLTSAKMTQLFLIRSSPT